MSIFHPVDPLTEKSHAEVGRSADIIFSVSDEILATMGHLTTPRFRIGHGLAPPFAELAENPLPVASRSSRVRVGYAGNLSFPPLGRVALRRMVEENPDAEFHFWGPADLPDGIDPSIRPAAREFIAFLERAGNVVLHGSVSSYDLAKGFSDMDCFVLSYVRHATQCDRSNSHKILEYLSTGKVVVGSRMSAYAEMPDLIRMPPDDDDTVLPGLLRATLADIGRHNSNQLQAARRRVALDNTYERQLERIIGHLESLR